MSSPASKSSSSSSSSSLSESVLLSFSRFYRSYWASLSFLDELFVMANFLKSLICFFNMTRNCLSYCINILPSYSTLFTFFWSIFSNLIFSLSWPICLMFRVIWSTSFIYSWNISLTPCLIVRCLSSLLSVLVILYYFYLLDIFIL